MHARRKRTRSADVHTSLGKRSRTLKQVSSLLDLTADRVSALFPYEEVEKRLGCIPGPVLQRIQLYSFPRNEAHVELYSSNKLHVNSTDLLKQPFHIGSRLLENEAVSEVSQIGFHVNGKVTEKTGVNSKQKLQTYKCSLTFDRNCITSTECGCQNKNLLWCAHLVAVALYRIRRAKSVPIKPPISDSVIDLKKCDLQKLLLVLVSKHRNQILPTLQTLLDELKVPGSEFGLLPGLPDPTAGGSSDDASVWHMNQTMIQQQIRYEMVEGTSGKCILVHMNKVREMFCAGDQNYSNLLLAINDVIIEESAAKPFIQNCQRMRRIYDELQSLWLCVMVNPDLLPSTKSKLASHLKSYLNEGLCPKENPDDPQSRFLLESVVNAHEGNSNEKDNVLHMAATVESLTMCNHVSRALTVAKNVVKVMREKTSQLENSFSYSYDLVDFVFNFLCDNKLLCEAFEFALMCLSNSCKLPKGEYAQNRFTHRCEKLVYQLEKVDRTSETMQRILLAYSKRLFDADTCFAKQSDTLPNHCFIRYLFESIVDIDEALAFQLGHYYLSLSPNKGAVIVEEVETSLTPILHRAPRFGAPSTENFCHIRCHVEHQQGELAASLLKHCSKYGGYLKITLTSILGEIKQAHQLLRLAKSCQSSSISLAGERNEELLGAAFELGVRSVRLVTEGEERKSSIRWLVSCAVDTGQPAVEFLIRNWSDLFAPKEICGDVAPVLTSQPVLFHLGMTSPDRKSELVCAVRNMVIEACIKDPVPCVLFALTLSEDDGANFGLVCQIVFESSDKFSTAQLFRVARYLDTKRHPLRAYRTGVKALKKIDISMFSHHHPAICDVLWLCNLSCNLGMDELTQVVPVLENCIHNPLLLTEIAERCSVHTSGRKAYSCQKEPLNRLVASAQKLFIQDIEYKLQSLTRKNYNDFMKYMHKIKRAFLLADDGNEQFHWLIDYIMTSQKGKKKLHQLISETFLK